MKVQYVFRTYLITYGFSKSSTKTSEDSAECVNNNETKTDTKFIFDFGQ